MKAVPIKEAEGQLDKLIDAAYRGEVIVLTNGKQEVTLVAPRSKLNLDEDSPELEAELLKAADGPFAPYRESELREIADRALRELSRKRQCLTSLAFDARRPRFAP
jgi:antitoxin (DNA-binding transcriptional repressor) of toxin-antitoxin stability system